MNIGIVSRSFAGMPVAEAAALMQSCGFNCTELCMSHPDYDGWVYNGVSKIAENGITPKLTAQKAEVFRTHGIEVTALGVFTNLLTPDDELRKACVDSFIYLMDCAAAAGIKNLSTELGFRPDKRGITTDVYESDFQRLKDVFALLGKEAGKRGQSICIEACVIDVIPSAKRLRDFLLQVKEENGVTNLRVLLDPANFIANSDEDDMFRYLAPHTAYFHGKDRKLNAVKGVLVGDGDINWVKFFENFFAITPYAPFIMEYATKDTVALAAERVRAYASQAKANMTNRGRV